MKNQSESQVQSLAEKTVQQIQLYSYKIKSLKTSLNESQTESLFYQSQMTQAKNQTKEKLHQISQKTHAQLREYKEKMEGIREVTEGKMKLIGESIRRHKEKELVHVQEMETLHSTIKTAEDEASRLRILLMKSIEMLKMSAKKLEIMDKDKKLLV